MQLFPIRWKVLALVSGVLTAAMVTYLVLAITHVRRDKIVYIYDLNASLARTLSAEVQAALETVSDKAQFFAREKDPDTLSAALFLPAKATCCKSSSFIASRTASQTRAALE